MNRNAWTVARLLRPMQAARGYILLETLVAMALLSITMLPIHHSMRDAIQMRGHAEDFTTARFLLDDLLLEQALQPEVVAANGNGTFAAPHERFQYSWTITRVDVPWPAPAPHLTPEQYMDLMQSFQGYMGKISATVSWTRAGQPFEATAETLMPTDWLWQPE